MLSWREACPGPAHLYIPLAILFCCRMYWWITKCKKRIHINQIFFIKCDFETVPLYPYRTVPLYPYVGIVICFVQITFIKKNKIDMYVVFTFLDSLQHPTTKMKSNHKLSISGSFVYPLHFSPNNAKSFHKFPISLHGCWISCTTPQLSMLHPHKLYISLFHTC